MKLTPLLLTGVILAGFQLQAEDAKTPAKTELKLPAAPGAATPAAPEIDEKELRQKISYAAGMRFGSQLKSSDYDFDTEEVHKAMKDVLSGNGTKLTDTEAQAVITKWQGQQQLAQAAKRKKQAEEGKIKGASYLAENGKKAGVKTTASGLQYEVVTEGSGKSPTTNDIVKVHYVGTLLDGTEFDSSRKRGQPAEFPVTGVIKGWTEALQLMKTGARWKLTIPSALAYGEMGNHNIPPNSVLNFDVELLDIKATPPPAPTDESVHAVSGEVIKVPSADDLKKGAKIEVLKEEDIKRLTATNAAAKATAPAPKK